MNLLSYPNSGRNNVSVGISLSATRGKGASSFVIPPKILASEKVKVEVIPRSIDPERNLKTLVVDEGKVWRSGKREVRFAAAEE